MTLFVASGLYNVSASREHLDMTTWLLDVARRQSIRTHSLGVGPPPPDDKSMVRLGAAYYELGCAPCHGAPGRPPSAWQSAMLPAPPPLDSAVREWSREQLYWIVLNGQKYTGMPSWISPKRRDEVWPVVAFLGRFPQLDADAYRELAGLGEARPAFSLELAEPKDRLEVCGRCHGRPGESPTSTLVPQLSGQPYEYLVRSLQSYAEGRRASGFMKLVASSLDDAEVRELSRTYSQAQAPAVPAEATAGDRERGKRIANEGIAKRGIPACLACHATAGNPAFPRLYGLSARYVEQQLHLFKDAHRDATVYGAIMKPIATRLDADDIADVAAYLSAMPPTGPQ